MFFGTRLFPVKRVQRTGNAHFVTQRLENSIPVPGKGTGCPRASDGVVADIKMEADGLCPQGVDDMMDSSLVHDWQIAKSFSKDQANNAELRQLSCQRNLEGMIDKPRPFSDIAERLKWHRTLIGLNQNEYSASIGVKRSAYSLWEAGTHRLSLDGALALRNKYGLSLDFMYEGIDDALPMTLRNAWIDRP